MGRHGTRHRLKVITDLNQPWGDVGHLHEVAVNACKSAQRALCLKRAVGRGDGKAAGFPALPAMMRGGTEVTKKRMATVWLDGCSGCHMSFLDIDERLLTWPKG